MREVPCAAIKTRVRRSAPEAAKLQALPAAAGYGCVHDVRLGMSSCPHSPDCRSHLIQLTLKSRQRESRVLETLSPVVGPGMGGPNSMLRLYHTMPPPGEAAPAKTPSAAQFSLTS